MISVNFRPGAQVSANGVSAYKKSWREEGADGRRSWLLERKRDKAGVVTAVTERSGLNGYYSVALVSRADSR